MLARTAASAPKKTVAVRIGDVRAAYCRSDRKKGNLTLATWRGKVRDLLQDDVIFAAIAMDLFAP